MVHFTKYSIDGRPNGQGLAAALRALANAIDIGAGKVSNTQKTPDLARAQRGRLQPIVRRRLFDYCFNRETLQRIIYLWHIGCSDTDSIRSIAPSFLAPFSDLPH